MSAQNATAGQLLMCPPAHYTVTYTINPWMDPTRPVDLPRAMAQWTRLRDVCRDVGYQVHTIEALPGLPDMVYAANGATVIDRVVYGAHFRYPERVPEATAYLTWFTEQGYTTHSAECGNEGEGDFLLAGEAILAGWGPRTERAAHLEAAALWGRDIISLELVDPRFYHLDTALAVLDAAAGDIAYYPPAFSPASREVLMDLFPDALLASDADAEVLGLNAISNGQQVIMTPAATRFAAEVRARGYEPVTVDTSELLRGGGGAKCCVLDIR